MTDPTERTDPAGDQGPIRVLVEHPNALVRLDLEEELTAAGFLVRSCGGPDGTSAHRCPLLDGEPCTMAGDADVILNALGSRGVAIYLAQRLALPATPICLDVDEWSVERLQAIVSDLRSSGPVPHGTALADRLREAFLGGDAAERVISPSLDPGSSDR